MEKQSFLLLSLLVVAASLALTEPATAADRAVPQEFNRTNFPEGFIFGASSAAYQVSCFTTLMHVTGSLNCFE